MKRLFTILLGAALAASCQQGEDSRFFAPELSFAEAGYSVMSDAGGVELVIGLSRPAPEDFFIGLAFSGTLQEGVQFTVPSHSISVPAGATEARLYIGLADDEIWDEESYIDVLLAPGDRYTVHPSHNCVTRVAVKKLLALPVLSIEVEDGFQYLNPYLEESVLLTLRTKKAPAADMNVTFSLDGLAAGTDYLLDGAASDVFVFPAGATSAGVELKLQKKDVSGYSKDVEVTMVPVKGVYGVATEGGSFSLALRDPVVDFSPLWKTGASQGEGHQVRQAIKSAAGEWNGNTAANWTLSSTGSNYLKSLKNLDPSTYGCPSVAVGLHILRLPDFFPSLRTTSGDAILDYGNNNNTRGFSPADSLFRFVLDKGSATEGRVLLDKPRRFTARTGDYTAWKDAWKADATAHEGDILRSANAILTGTVNVTLEKLEGRFNLASSTETLLFTAWFSSDSPLFMQGVDLETLGAVQENGLWKVEYKLWPR